MEPATTLMTTRRGRPLVAKVPVLVAVALVVAVLAGCDAMRSSDTLVPTIASGQPSTTVPSEPSASVTSPAPARGTPPALASPAAPSSVTAPTPSSVPAPIGDELIALVDGSGGLVTVDPGGGSRVEYPMPGVTVGFPAWSPDGKQIAVVGKGAETTALYVHAVDRGAGASLDPTVVYRSADRLPFYLYWSPDSRRIGFLTSEAVGLAFRVARVDGSARPDVVDEASVVRRGETLYWQWVDNDRAMLHVGGGAEAFTGLVGLDGNGIGAAIKANGIFRVPALSRSRRYVAYATSAGDGSGEIVVETTAGASHHSIPAFGPVAMLFDPTGDTLATIAADKPLTGDVGFPVGPLRLVDPLSGDTHTVLDGSVLACFWSPDGRTLAAIRLVGQAPGPISVVGRLALARADRPDARTGVVEASAGISVGVAFVDVTTGTVRGERVVRVADAFLTQLLPYFDQYALSHRLWSAESAAILLPLVADSGQDRLVAIPADGSEPRPIADGQLGFWSP